MITVSKNGRDKAGRFAKGNRYGSKPGTPNRTTVDVRALRERIVASWDRCGGDKLLARIAKADPVAYVKLIASLLPREDSPVQPFVVAEPGLHSPKALNFIACLEREREAQGEAEVTPSIVEKMLLRHARGELDEDYNADDSA